MLHPPVAKILTPIGAFESFDSLQKFCFSSNSLLSSNSGYYGNFIFPGYSWCYVGSKFSMNRITILSSLIAEKNSPHLLHIFLKKVRPLYQNNAVFMTQIF